MKYGDPEGLVLVMLVLGMILCHYIINSTLVTTYSSHVDDLVSIISGVNQAKHRSRIIKIFTQQTYLRKFLNI